MLPDTRSKWEDIAKGFEMKTNFPHCLEAADREHIKRVVKLKHSGSMC